VNVAFVRLNRVLEYFVEFPGVDFTFGGVDAVVVEIAALQIDESLKPVRAGGALHHADHAAEVEQVA